MSFLLDAWYAAAWDDQLDLDKPLYRTILNHKVCLLKEASGAVHALPNRCPHRFAPFQRGTYKNGVLRCGYHGLAFAPSGQCIDNPHGDCVIGQNFHLTPWPLVERYGMHWIWMGQPNRADPDLIPDYSMVFGGGRKTIHRYLHAKAGYELLIDNLLDLGHTAFLHATSLGSAAIVRSERSVRRDGDNVVYELWAPDGDAPPLFQQVMPWYRDKKVDHWMTSTWRAPSQIQQQVAFAPAGSNRQGGDILEGLHLLTPETDYSTHYFSALGRRFRIDEPEIDQVLYNAGEKAFTEEDFPMVEAIQAELAGRNFWDQNPIILSVDAGAVMARRILGKLIAGQAPRET